MIPCPWLPADLMPMRLAIARLAHAALGCGEEPLGSNRGPQVDAWNLSAGVPVGSYWCASFAADVWKRAGATLPPYPASCDSWMKWGKRHGTWHTVVPDVGDVVLYGIPGDARHIGVVIRVTPHVLSVEGNTTVEGAAFERNGTAVALKIVHPTDPILGYIRPTPSAPQAVAA